MWPFDQNNQPMYQQYSQAYDTGNYNGIDPNQAMGHMQQFIQNAPPNMQQQVYQQHFEQMPYSQRAQFAQQMPPEYGMNPNDPRTMAQGFQQMGQQQPNILSQLFGQGTSFGNPMAHGGLGGLVGLAAKAMMNHQGGGNFGGNPFGGGQQQYGYGQQQNYGDQQQYGYPEGGGYERREREERREGEGYERRERRDEF